MSPVEATCATYDREQIRRYLNWGGNPDVGGFYSGSLLHYAVKHNDLDTIELLIRRGADVNIRGGDAGTTAHVLWTPLGMAEHCRRADAADLLRRHGAVAEVFWWP